MNFRGTRVTQSVKHPTSAQGHDLRVREFKPHIGLCAQSLDPGSDSVSPSLSAPPLLVLCLCLSKINKC